VLVSQVGPPPAAGQTPPVEVEGTGQSGPLQFEDFVGIYTIDSYTRNETSCDAEGDSIAESVEASHFVALTGTLFGRPFLSAFACVDPDDCRAVAAAVREGGAVRVPFSYAFDQADTEALHGEMIFAGFLREEGTVCNGADVTVNRWVRDGDGVRIESRHTEVGDYAVPEGGRCSAEATRAAAAEAPCASLTVLVGRFSEPL
jgi:hypothetical protein